MISIATDFVHDRNNVEPCLRYISAAGFQAVHWCQHWSDDYIYTQSEVRTIKSWLAGYGLLCRDLHASAGKEKDWGSADEYGRIAGLELIENRIRMIAELGGDAIVLHLPAVYDKDGRSDEAATFGAERLSAIRRSMDALITMAKSCGIRIALENMPTIQRRNELISGLLLDYPVPELGICYDSGHGNILDRQQEWLSRWKDRLYVVHLHDNLGEKDQHLLPFEGTIDWPKVMKIIGSSNSYKKGVNLEAGIYAYPQAVEMDFLSKALDIGRRLEAML